MPEEPLPNLELQIKVSQILSRGFVFSLVWLAGIGSLIAIISGLQALKIIKKYEGKIEGKNMAWWCIIVGGIGIIVLPLSIFHFR